MNNPLLFQKYLKEGEKILWTGQPQRGIKIRDADIILIPVSIILIGFAVILDYVLMNYDSPLAFKALGVMFALGGIYSGGIRFILDASHRRKTFYCITNKRVLVLSGSKKTLKTLPVKNIDQLDKTEERDGSGFIIFGNTNPLWPWLLGKFYMSGDSIPGLEMLPDVNTVFDLLEDLIRVEISPTIIDQLQSGKKHELN